MTAGIRNTIKTMTGTYVDTCPWRAFKEPFVSRVIDAMRFFESGQLAFKVPHPSHRLVEGIAYYHSVDNRVYGSILDRDRAERKRESERQRALAEMGRRG
jgi:hypothetical protein